MRILFYNHTGMVSGAERVMSMILDGLDREQYELVVACPDQSPMMAMVEKLRIRARGLPSLQARFTCRPHQILRYLLSFFQVIRFARALVIEEAPDVIHANSIRAGMVMAVATIGMEMPVIWHAHDILPHHPLSSAVRLLASLSKRNRIVAVSQAVADRFRGLLLRPMKKRVPIRVIHNSVDLSRFKPDARARREIRRTLGLKKNQLVFGIVGQLTPRKGQLELIQAYAQASADKSNMALLIIGAALFNRDDQYVTKLQDEVEALGIFNGVSFLGSRDDIPQLLQGLDVLVVNSHEEPFALTVLEGLSSSTPVLATAVGGTPEMIQHGRTGWLVKPRNRNELAGAMLALAGDEVLRRQLGRNGRQQAIARFSIERFLGDVESLYAEVFVSGAPGAQEAAAQESTMPLQRLKNAVIMRSLF